MTVLSYLCAEMSRTPLKSHLALLGVNLIYGINFVVAKEVMPSYIQPFGFIILRVGIATLLFWLLAAFWHKSIAATATNDIRQANAKEWGTFLLCGLLGVAINQMLFFKGLSLTSPIHGALIMITTPILVLLMSGLLVKGEPLNWRKSLGVLLGLAGAAMVIVQGANNTTDATSPWGDFCIFLNAASYGLYLVMAKPLLARYHFLTVTKWTFLLGFWVVLFFGWREFIAIEWHTFTPFVWACVAYVVLMVTFMAYLLNSYALRSVHPSLVSAYIYTQPLIATFVAVLLGKDSISLGTVLAATLIFIGVYGVSK